MGRGGPRSLPLHCKALPCYRWRFPHGPDLDRSATIPGCPRPLRITGNSSQSPSGPSHRPGYSQCGSGGRQWEVSEEAAAGPDPEWARPSLAHQAFMEAGSGLAGWLADRQGKEEGANVEGSQPLSGGQPGPQPGSPGSSTAPTRQLQEALSGFPRCSVAT